MGFLCQTLILATLIFNVMCYPDGVGLDSACTSLTPLHGVSSQTTTAPYSITFSPTSFSPGQTVTVTLTSSSTGFKGFMIQARRADTNQNQELLGSFSGDSATTRQACSGKALVHSSSMFKTSVTFSWIAPAISVGNIEFRVTYVQSRQIFWANRVSSVLVETIPTTATTLYSTTTTLTTASPIPYTTSDTSYTVSMIANEESSTKSYNEDNCEQSCIGCSKNCRGYNFCWNCCWTQVNKRFGRVYLSPVILRRYSYSRQRFLLDLVKKCMRYFM